MKKLIGILIILASTVISIGKFLYTDASFMNRFYREFDTTVNIVTNPESMEKSKYVVQKIASKNNISFIKEVYKPKSRKRDTQNVDIYIYLNDIGWFKDEFKNINFHSNHNDINKFEKLDNIGILTTKKVSCSPYSDIEGSVFNGDYHIRGEATDVHSFVEELNSHSDLTIEATIEDSFSLASELTQKQVFLYFLFTIIILTALIFNLVVYNSSLSREISIRHLLGHGKLEFCIGKSVDIITYPSIFSILSTMSVLYVMVKPSSIWNFMSQSKSIILTSLIVIVSLMVLEFLLLTFKMKSTDTISWIKGRIKNYNRSFVFVKIGTVCSALYLFSVSIIGIQEYMTLSPYLRTWDNSKNYLNISCAWPWTYVEDDKKFEKVVVPSFNKLWDELELRGAVLFDAPNLRLEGIIDDENHLRKQAFGGRFAYVNKNYIDFSGLEDDEGQKISKYDSSDNEWIVFVPENIQISDADKENIRNDHIYKTSERKRDISSLSEKYIEIKKDQISFTFDGNSRLDEPSQQNYVLIMVRGTELNPNGDIKIPSLVNGKYHPYVENPRDPYKELKRIINSSNSGQYILYLSSIYDDVEEKIESLKIEASIYFTGFLMSMIILALIIKMDIEVYFYHEKQRITISRLFGYDFFTIHKKKIIRSTLSYLEGMFLLVMFILSTLRFFGGGLLFIPRDGWSIGYIIFVLGISTAISIICIYLEVGLLKRSERDITMRLKEGS